MQRMKPTGVSTDDMFNMVTTIYNRVEVKNEVDDYGTQFKFANSDDVL